MEVRVSNWIRRALLAATGVSGIAVLARALHGPFTGSLQLRSPLNAESWFGLFITLLFVLNFRREDSEISRVADPFRSRDAVGAAVILAAVIAACYARAIGHYFLSDDFVLLRQASQYRFHWRSDLMTGGGDGYFRPMFSWWLALLYPWAAWDPVRWHAIQLILHFVNSVLVFQLVSRLTWSRFVALFAAVLFAVHGTRPEAAIWLAGSADLLAAFFVLAGLLCFLNSHEQKHSGRHGWTVGALLAMILAILSKEAAYPFPLWIGLLVIGRSGDRRRGLISTVPFFVVACALFLHRWILFEGVGGYQDVHTGQAQALSFGLLSSLKVLVMRLWAILYFPINWSVEPEWLLALLTGAYMVCLLARLSRPTRGILFPLGFLVIGVLPPLHLLLIGQDLEKSRLLYLPAVGFCMFLAGLIGSSTARRKWILAAVILAFHVAALEHNIDQREYAAARARAACTVAAQAVNSTTRSVTVDGPLPNTLRGVYFFANGFPECLEHMTGFPVDVRYASTPEANLRWDQEREELVSEGRE